MADVKKLKPIPRPHQTASAQRLSAFRVPNLDPGMASALRQVLEASNFTNQPPMAADQGGNDQFTLHDLFVRGEAVSRHQVECVFPAGQLASLIRSGLLRETDGKVQSLFQAQSYKGLIFLSDFFRDSHKTGFVLQVGPAGKYLADLTIRKPFLSALDLGCGCGIQALLAAKHCERVTATDINPRALQLTRLNANLNGVSNLEILKGSFFEPVRGRTFDLIVANLPYVITPENKYLYRDSGESRDAALFSLVREIPSCLKEHGFAHILANWIHAPDQPYWQPFKVALQNLAVDAWLFHNGSKNPAEYVEMWLDIPATETSAYEQKKKDWLAWYREQQIELIALGAITLRRRSAVRNWACSATITKSLAGPAGGQIFDLFQAQDDLDITENSTGLENARLVSLQPAARFSLLANRRMLCCTPGMEISTEVQAGTINVMKFLNGRNTLGEAIDFANVSSENIPDDIRSLISVGILQLIR